MPNSYTITVDGTPYTFEAEQGTPLLVVLREILVLDKPRFACRAGLCGTCSVRIDGKATMSCQTRIEKVDGAAIETIARGS